MNKKWECHLCCKESKFQKLPAGYLGNYHPLCKNCADEILSDKSHEQRNRLTFHYSVGDIVVHNNIIFERSRICLN